MPSTLPSSVFLLPYASILQAVSLTMIAYATFAHHDAALVQAVSAKVLHMPGVFDPQAIANTLWALALLDDLSPPVWNSLLVAFIQAERFNSEHAVHCYAHLVLMCSSSAVLIMDLLL